MSKRLCFSIFFVLVLSLALAGYSDPGTIMLDFDERGDVNTEPGFTSFLISDNGTEINGITIDLAGNIDDSRRFNPNSSDSGIPIYTEEIYRDFVYGVSPSGVTITLWGLGANQECDITIYAFDHNSTPRRLADWTANGDYLLTTEFEGNNPDNWPSPWWEYGFGHEPYDFNGIAHADEFGRIVLESTIDPCSTEGEAFAFVNGLVVVPKGAYVPPPYAQHPVPLDGEEDVPGDVILKWKESVYAEKHDVYFGTNNSLVEDANRSNPLGVLAIQGHDSNAYDPCGLLKLDTTYYWRIDEVNDPNIWKGQVWSFRTLPYFVIDDFDSYEDDSALQSVWTTNGTSAEVSVETTITRDGNSMKYEYENNLSPYYSEACVDIADLGIDDPDWLGIGANALVLSLYGQMTNPIGEQMYVRLTDGDSPAGTATVYDNINYARFEQWNKWSIALTEFNDVNLANVASITIGFGDGSEGDAGTVYFEDITLDIEVEVLAEVAGEVDVYTVYQELEGFGGAACYDASALAYHPSREEVYDLLFRDLGLDALRIKNTYDISSSEITATGQIVAAARQPTRNPNLKLLLVPWSPAAYLKSTGDLGTLNGTLKKDAYGNYVYDDYATWWLNSLTGSGGWNSVGIYPDYISIQNEPDWGQQDQVCRFTPVETSTYAGYDKAFEAVYNKLDGNVSPMPKMLAPESVGFGSSRTFINVLVNRGQINHIYGFSHHLYGDGNYTNPDGMISGMINYRNTYGYKPLFQTEFGGDGTPTFDHAVLLAQHIYNCLHYERVTSYYQWTSFRNGSYSTGGMINLTPGGGYIVRDLYWFFKHYAYFTDPGWYVINTSLGGTGASNLRMIAFKSPDDDELTVVILNKSANGYSLELALNGFIPNSSEVYRSSETENWLYLGTYGSSLILPARSITTTHMTGTTLFDCADVLSAGYGLTSDINPDCYVDYEDLAIITDYWLDTDCGSYDDCEGADFEPTDGTVNLLDLSTFAKQWMWCNDPEDPNCTANW